MKLSKKQIFAIIILLPLWLPVAAITALVKVGYIVARETWNEID